MRGRLRRVDVVLLLVLAISLALKLAIAFQMGGVELRKDERAYVGLAETLVASGRYESLFLAPGYPFFVATVLGTTGSLVAVRATQAALGTLLALLVYLVAAPPLGRSAARWAAALVAFDPVLGVFGLMIWTETLFLVLLWGALAVLLVRFRLDATWRWLAGGLLLGLAALTRPIVLGTTPLVVLWLLWRTHRARRGEAGLEDWPRVWSAPARAVVLLAVGALAAVLPWTLRNYRETGSFIFIDTNSAYSALIGTEPEAMFLDKDDHWSGSWAWLAGEKFKIVLRESPGSVQRLALTTGIRNVREDPARYLAASLVEGAHLWTLDHFGLRHLRNGWYGDVSRGASRTALVVSVLASLVILGGGALGLVLLPPGPLRALAWIFVGYTALVHAILFSLSRYQVPMRPFLAVGAAWLLVSGVSALRGLGSAGRPTPRGWLAGAVVLLLLFAWARDLPLLHDMWATGGANHRFVSAP